MNALLETLNLIYAPYKAKQAASACFYHYVEQAFAFQQDAGTTVMSLSKTKELFKSGRAFLDAVRNGLADRFECRFCKFNLRRHYDGGVFAVYTIKNEHFGAIKV